MSLKRKGSALPLGDAKKPKANASITSFFTAPKSSPPKSSPPNSSPVPKDATSSTKQNLTETPAVSAPALKWDKEKWIKTLTAEQKDLLALEIGTLDETWLKELRDEVTSSSFLDLKRFLKKEHEAGKKIFPPANDVYSWYTYHPSALHALTPDQQVKTYPAQYSEGSSDRAGPIP